MSEKECGGLISSRIAMQNPQMYWAISIIVTAVLLAVAYAVKMSFNTKARALAEKSPGSVRRAFRS
jgi:hypothetical protein